MKMNKILVTPRSLTKEGHPTLDLLTQAGYEVIFSTPGKSPDEEELLRLLPGCIGMLAGV
jgi:D-3-phosphoglycerate dehydrogenase